MNTKKMFNRGDLVHITDYSEMYMSRNHKYNSDTVWVVGKSFRNIPHGNVMYEIFTLNGDALEECAAYPYAMEPIETPSSSALEIAEIITSMLEKRKIENMTLREIRELKEGYQIRVAEALSAIQSEFMEKYDCGFPIIHLETELHHQSIENEFSHLSQKEWNEYNIKIKFSKEDD